MHWLLRVKRPSFYGMVFSLLCVYIPLSGKVEDLLFKTFESLPPGVNPLNLFFLLLFIFIPKRQGSSDAQDKVWMWFCLWCIGLVFSALTSAFLNESRPLTDLMTMLKRWVDPIIVYYFARKLHTENDRSVAFAGMALGVAFFAIHLFGQGLDFGDKVRIGGLMNDPNAAAAFMAAYVSVFIAIMTNTEKGKRVIFFFGLTLLACFAEFQTVSRGGALGMGVSILVSVWFSKKKSTKFLILAFFAVALLLLPSFIPEKLSARFAGQDMHGSEGTDEAEVSSNVRLAIWAAGVQLCLSNPLGVGIGNFQSQIGEYGGPAFRDAHNMYLLVCAEMGWLGLFVYLILLYQLYRRAREGLICSGTDRISIMAGQALAGATLALIFTNMFSATLRDIWVFGYLAILAAIIVSNQGRDGQKSLSKFNSTFYLTGLNSKKAQHF